jgi:hypothetical protein
MLPAILAAACVWPPYRSAELLIRTKGVFTPPKPTPSDSTVIIRPWEFIIFPIPECWYA